MAGLVPAIYDFHSRNKDMDGRNKPGHDGTASNITVNLSGLWYKLLTGLVLLVLLGGRILDFRPARHVRLAIG
jgi:hypothetical protein